MKNKSACCFPEIIPMIGSVLLCQMAGIIGSVFTVSAIPGWYATLNKPWFNPPSFIFGPVWITLYTVMGIALYRIYRLGMRNKSVAFAVYVFLTHLVFNSLWSVVFFGMKELGLAFMLICILWGLIAFCMVLFQKIDKPASYMLLPYLLWVTFASILNLAIWMLNG